MGVTQEWLMGTFQNVLYDKSIKPMVISPIPVAPQGSNQEITNKNIQKGLNLVQQNSNMENDWNKTIGNVLKLAK